MEKIQIICTSCGQKFAVSESYKGRMVECGGCDHRFKVEGAAIARQKKKFYPGERAALNSESFAKVESDSVTSTENKNELGFQPASYQKNVSADYAQPPSNKRTFAIIAGVILISLFILIFMLGSQPDGMLKDMDEQKRILLAGFIAILGSGLIIGGARHKFKGIVLALVLGGSLAALPFVFHIEPTPSSQAGLNSGSDTISKTDDSKIANKERQAKIDQYKESIGYGRVEAKRLESETPQNIKALVIKDMGSHTDTINNYLKYELNLDTPPSIYNTGLELAEEDGSIRRVNLLIIDSDVSDEKLIEMTKKFGTPVAMDDMRTDLQVIEVQLKEELLQNTSTKVLTDETHAEFFSANYLELSHISHDRQMKAITRLSNVKSSLGRRADIAARLGDMINVKDKRRSIEVIRALKLWALPEYKLDKKIVAYANAHPIDTVNLKPAVMEYLVEKKVAGISGILEKQWLNDNGHLVWDDLIQKAGGEGETAIINALPKADSAHLKSAAAILSKIGTSRSIPALTTAIQRAKSGDAKYLKASIDEIKSRR